MSKYLFVTKKRFHPASKSKNNFSRKNRLSAKFFISKLGGVFLAILIIFSFVSYLIQVNSLATKGYQIKELEKQLNELMAEKADLELETLSLQSLSAVKDRINDLGMVASGQAEYLSIAAPVARARWFFNDFESPPCWRLPQGFSILKNQI